MTPADGLVAPPTVTETVRTGHAEHLFPCETRLYEEPIALARGRGSWVDDAEGRTYLNPALGARLAAAPIEQDGPPDGLSEREIEILRLIALGHTNTEIGDQLFLSVRTVESHRAHIQQKLGVSTRSELVRYALDHDLIDH